MQRLAIVAHGAAISASISVSLTLAIFAIMANGGQDDPLREEEEEAVCMQKYALYALRTEDFLDADDDARPSGSKSTAKLGDDGNSDDGEEEDDDDDIDNHDVVGTSQSNAVDIAGVPCGAPEIPMLIEEEVAV